MRVKFFRYFYPLNLQDDHPKTFIWKTKNPKKKKKILIVNLNSLLQASTRKVKIKPEIFNELQCNLKGYRAEALKETTLNYL